MGAHRDPEPARVAAAALAEVVLEQRGNLAPLAYAGAVALQALAG